MKPSSLSAVKTPLYKQIREYILRKIEDRVWLPDQQIPSEHELAEQFQVSRVTVRGALTELDEEGFIYRIRGKGSFIHADADRLLMKRQHKSQTHTKMVALLIPRLDNRFTANVVSGIEEELSAHGYQLIVARTRNSKELEKQKLYDMVQLGVEGIIIYPISDETYSEDILKLSLNQFPLVVVDRYLRGIDTNCVCSDNFEGAKTAATHLIELGHRKIAFISSDQKTTSIEDRLSGFQQALAEHDIPFEYRYQALIKAKQGRFEEDHLDFLRNFFLNNPDITACFATHYSIALSVFQVLKEMNKSVPQDFSVICFDDYEGSEHAAIPITCVDQQDFRLGQESAKLLISNIQASDQERRMVLIPTNFIVRSSTGAVNVH